MLLITMQPMPKHSAFMGHLTLIRDAILVLPTNCAPDIATSNVAKKFKDGLFYLDLMPFERVNLIVTSANAAAQMQRHPELMKPKDVKKVINTLAGGHNLVSMPEYLWKPWRTTFNRAFSDGSMRKLAPMVAREVENICYRLSEQARSGTRERLEDLIGKLTIGIIVSMGMYVFYLLYPTRRR
jgi:cytochrome P450